MAGSPLPAPDLPAPPWDAFRAELLEMADTLERSGDLAGAGRLRERVRVWWASQHAWNVAAAELLRVHHDINNALVGVSGNAQLLRVGAVGQQSGVRERLEVILRESSRIEQGARRLRELRVALMPETLPRPEGGSSHER